MGIVHISFTAFCCPRGAVNVFPILRNYEYAADHRVALQDCYFYSDSISDLPLLAAVGYPRVVNPDLLLRREARRRGWEVLSFTQ